MDGSTIATALRGISLPQQLVNTKPKCWGFASIPPERTGLHGEYDYYGLSKRVSHYLQANVENEFRRLKIRQRGRVIILSGQLTFPYQLRRIVDLVLSVNGVDEVETDGVRVSEAC
ncbi:MAG: BON domain-containing protein [Leptolyngbyaceae cyanobacterium]